VLVPVGTALLEGEAAERLRAWGTDPNLGHTLATGLADAGFRVITADYEGHLAEHPKARTLTAAAVAADLLAVADAAGADRFAYYGCSWLALAGLQSLRGFDERAALGRLDLPRLVFAGADDNIRYGPRWDNAYVAIADAVRENRDELTKQSWTVELVAGTDHMSAMQADKVLPLLIPWLRRHWC
jgi:hypothetical protein